MSTTIKLDLPLLLAHEATPATHEAHEAVRLIATGVRPVREEVRSYFVTVPPKRVLFVLRDGLTLENIGTAVEALIGWDEGTPSFVKDIGQRHTKISILGPAAGPVDVLLSDVLAKAPPDHDEKRTVVAPASLWRRLDDMGYGDVAAGLAKAIELAEAYLNDD